MILPRRVGGATAAVLGAVALGACGGGSTSVPKNASRGLRAFDQASCGSCHRLAAAGATGTAGPDLNGRSLSAARVERFVREGGGGMPAFAGQLSDAQIRDVSAYVARATQ